MGPGRDGLWKESDVVKEIPSTGLPVLWRVEVGGGYSGPAVAAGQVFLSDFLSPSTGVNNNPSVRDVRDGTERFMCFDFKTGKPLWKVEQPTRYNVSYAAGPRATPTVDGDRVYFLGSEGTLACLKAQSGETVWKKDLARVYGAETPLWGHSAHPLVQGNLLYCLAGGAGSAVVALDKMTGQEVWRALTATEIGYCPPQIATIAGKTQLVVWHPEAVCGLDLEKGTELWSYPLAPNYKMSVCAPRIQGNRMFASGIGDIAAMIEFDSAGQPTKTLWKGVPKKAVYSCNTTPLWIGEMIFGADCQTGQFVAFDPQTSQRHWETFELTTGGDRRASHGTAFAVQNGDLTYLFTETGELVIAKLTKAGFEAKGRMKVLEPTGECFGRPVVWSHPAFSNRCMVARNDRELVCVDLSAKR
jgi:outer membrane protein assembly factor BamB